MRFLKLRIENLASLYGVHDLDLERGLAGAPIFLVTGPTGAGKSTLMDAIALALFGRTPRLREKTKDEESDSRLLMSRGTGQLSVTLELGKIEGGRARRYRASWSCHRARQRAEGNLQRQRRSIERLEDDGAWTVLGSGENVKDYQPAFDAVLEGLGAEDFERSILLAQGEFTAFLRASEGDRAAILERLTNTAEYKEIGRRAAERRREAQEAYDRVKAQVDGVELHDADVEAAWRVALDEATRREGELALAKEGATRAIAWLRGRDELAQKLASSEAAVAARRADVDREAEALARLAEAERCASGAEPLASARRAEGERAAAAGALPALVDAVARLAREAEVARAAAKAAHAIAEAADARLTAERPSIDAARALRQRTIEAEGELGKATKLATEAARRAERLAVEAERAREVLRVAEEERARAEAARGAVEAARPLVEELAGLEARLATIARAREELRALARRRVEAAGRRAEAEAALARADGSLASAEAGRANAAGALAEAGAALAAELGDAANAGARREALAREGDRLAAREAALRDARRLEAEAARRGEEARELGAEAARAGEGIAASTAAIADAAAAAARARQERDHAAERLEELRWALGLAAQRSRLRPGEACALCGSEAHPYVEDHRFADHDREVEARVAALEASRLGAERALAAADAKGAALGADLAGLRATRSGLEARLGAAEEARAEALAGLEVAFASFGDAANGAALEALAGALVSERDALAAAARRLDEAEARAAKARTALAARDRAVAEAAGEVKAKRTALDGLTAQVEDATRAEAALGEALGADEARLGEALRGRAVSIGEGIEAAVVEARRRAASVRAADAAVEGATKAEAVARSGCERAEADREHARHGAEELEAQRLARAGTVAELAPRVAEALGGADPDAVEAARTAEVAAARRAAAESDGEANDRERALAAARAHAVDGEARLARATEAAVAAGATLEAALGALGLASREELAARLVDEADRRALEALRRRLHEALAGATTQHAALVVEVAAHAAARPDGVDEAEAREAAEARRAEAETRRAEAAEERARLGFALEAQDKARAKRAAYETELARAKEELATWHTLHALIGVGDGDEFKRYAQLYNLDRLVAKANHHLAQLAPRYRLVGAETDKGDRRLAFSVADDWQAGRVRPLTTLSGGESFLVSLALALGLSDFRSVRMPIETLLLDEGFGTLDRETLGAAMNALQALNARGTQVGIISHVEGLKDAIPAHVVVERLGGGRSTVRIVAGT